MVILSWECPPCIADTEIIWEEPSNMSHLTFYSVMSHTIASPALLNINAGKGRCQLGKCSCFIILAEKINNQQKSFNTTSTPEVSTHFLVLFHQCPPQNKSLHQQTFGPRLHRADRHPKCFPAGRPARKSSPLKQRKTFFSSAKSWIFVQPNGKESLRAQNEAWFWVEILHNSGAPTFEPHSLSRNPGQKIIGIEAQNQPRTNLPDV